jgi:hypothetical protein
MNKICPFSVEIILPQTFGTDKSVSDIERAPPCIPISGKAAYGQPGWVILLGAAKKLGLPIGSGPG